MRPPYQCAKICLGLLSKGNRHIHTIRSLEVPAIGSLSFAERTVECEFLYEEGKGAEIRADADECADKSHALLADLQRTERIVAAGRVRAAVNGFSNKAVLASVLWHTFRSVARYDNERGADGS